MIGYLKGKVVHRGPNFITVNTGNIGYRVYIARELLAKENVELFIFHNIREGVSELFGFEKKEELEVFELLLGVSGVGPRVALSIVSGLGPSKILSSISRGDATIFKTISGVGNKVAAKIVVELKNKVAGGELIGSLLPEDDETVEALVALGYKKYEALPYLKDIPENLTTPSEKVKYILKSISRKNKKL